MTRISQVFLKKQSGFHMLTVRKTINFMEEYSNFVGYSLSKIITRLDSENELASGVPTVCFHNMDLAKLDVEVGFPVANPVDGAEDVKAVTIPTQKVVTAIDMGPYEKQDPTLEDIFAWIQDHGYVMGGEIYYQYLNDNDRPESEFLTLMIVPVR